MNYCGRKNDNAILGNVANSWGPNWVHFGLLAGFHTGLYLPTVFWSKLDYGVYNAIPQTLLPGQLELNGGHGYRIRLHGNGLYPLE